MIEFEIMEKPQISFNIDNSVNISFKTKKTNLEAFDSLINEKKYIVKVAEAKQKRTKDQNSYLWELIGLVAAKVGETKDYVYRAYIKDYGCYEAIPIKNEAAARFMDSWSAKGLGWFCEKLCDSKINGYVNVLAYYGSSSYTKEEMNRVIDAIIYDCKQLNIPYQVWEE